MVSSFLWFSRSNVSLDHVHQHHRYSHPFRIILTPSAKELAITFCPSIRIAYVSTLRNRHSVTVDRTLVSQNSMVGLKFHRGACVLVHRLSYPLGKTTNIFSRGDRNCPRVPNPESALRASQHKVGFDDFQFDAQITLWELGRGLLMRSHADTPSLKRV
ncbi:hypothetical protein Taro_049637 [Colocasia esculenta]|uniref:Uncharacterized protein n=1 Tax=Colocasia esculenta TaxID=4460 RepID=A0A843XBN2_COLES|nr:hypothetical protein [Colocasia esculenta]